MFVFTLFMIVHVLLYHHIITMCIFLDNQGSRPIYTVYYITITNCNIVHKISNMAYSPNHAALILTFSFTHWYSHMCELHTQSCSLSHTFTHMQEVNMVSVRLDVGVRCGFRFHIGVILTCFPVTVTLCGEINCSFLVLLITELYQIAARLCKYVCLLFMRT